MLMKHSSDLNGYFKSLHGLKMALVQLGIYHTEQTNVAMQIYIIRIEWL